MDARKEDNKTRVKGLRGLSCAAFLEKGKKRKEAREPSPCFVPVLPHASVLRRVIHSAIFHVIEDALTVLLFFFLDMV